MNKAEVAKLAHDVRRDCLRMVYRGQSGHIGSMMSVADILAVMYSGILNVTPDDPAKADRDRLIFSKGHGGAALFATLAELNYFPKEWLDGYYQDAGKLSGHISHHIDGVEFSTGSLGHGLPVACGMAMAAIQAKKTHRIFCIVSDGDCNEGSTWEAIMLAGQHHWDNLTMIIDYNRLQALGKSEDIIDLEPLDKKLELFGWAVKTIDGHNLDEIEQALLALPIQPGKPSAIIAKTVKGKGIDFAENDYKWHYGGITEELYNQGCASIDAMLKG